MANVIKHKRGSGSDPVANDLVVGEVAIRTDVGKLFTKMDNGSVAEIAGGGSDIAINTLSSSSGTGGGSATFNGSAYRFTLSAPPSVSAAQLLVSINGVIQKPVTGTGQPSEGFAVDGTDIILGDAPATGSDFFILTFKSLGVSEPADNSVTSAKIVDGAIVNADVNASAAIDVSKLSGVLPLAGGTLVGNLAITREQPIISFNDSTDNPDYYIGNIDGAFRIQDTTNAVTRFQVNTDGHVDIAGNLDVGAGIDVTGAITGTGNLNIGNNTSANPFTYLRFGASQFGAADIRPTNEASHKVGLSFYTDGTQDTTINPTERMRIDSSGRLLLGVTAVHPIQGNNPNFLVSGTSFATSMFCQQRYGASAAGATLVLSHSRNGTQNSHTILQSGDEFGKIRFYGSDGNDFNNYGVEISAEVDGTPGSDDMPGRLLFKTTADGSASSTERLRIASNGDIGINTTTINRRDAGRNTIQFDYSGSDASQGLEVRLSNSAINGNASTDNLQISYIGQDFSINNTENGNIVFYNNGSERFRINPSGNIGVGTSSPDRTIHCHNSSNTTNVRAKFSNGTTGEGASDGFEIGINGSDPAQAVLVNYEASPMAFFTNASERMRIDSSGNVGIGNTNPGSFHSSGENLVVGSGSGEEGMTIFSGNTSAGVINFADSTSGSDSYEGRILYDHNTNHMKFHVNNGTERLRIDSSGRVLVGTSTSRSVGGSTHRLLLVENTDARAGIGLLRNSNNALGAYVTLGKTRGTSNGSNTIVQDDDILGIINFAGADGTDAISVAADIRARIDGTPGSNDMPGRLVFSTTADGDASPTTRMTINSTGHALFGTTTDSVYDDNSGNGVVIRGAHGAVDIKRSNDLPLNINRVGGDGGFIRMLRDGTTKADIGIKSNNFVLDVNNSERLRVKSNGKILINRTNEDGTGVIHIAVNSGGGISVRTAVQSSQTMLDFGNQNGVVGSIKTSGSSTSFNTSSDYRLKENAVAISDGITRLKTLKPYKFNFKADATTTVDGFFAHEVTAVPEAISGTKDETEDILYTEDDTIPSGKKIGDVKEVQPVYQGIDQSKLVPLLVAALQEAIGRIEALEAK